MIHILLVQVSVICIGKIVIIKVLESNSIGTSPTIIIIIIYNYAFIFSQHNVKIHKSTKSQMAKHLCVPRTYCTCKLVESCYSSYLLLGRPSAARVCHHKNHLSVVSTRIVSSSLNASRSTNVLLLHAPHPLSRHLFSPFLRSCLPRFHSHQLSTPPLSLALSLSRHLSSHTHSSSHPCLSSHHIAGFIASHRLCLSATHTRLQSFS